MVTSLIVLPPGCRSPEPAAVRVATTTSLDNSGLLPVIAEAFRRQTGIRIEPFVVGSGRAFAMARAGSVDIVMTHEAHGESALMRDGVALHQRPFLENRFLLVGPPENPARIPAGATVVEAFRRIHDTGARFASRGDESGTHVRELEIWALAGRDPVSNAGYQRLGQGMSALLRSASELQAYTLTDTATYESMRRSVRLVPVAWSGDHLRNVYTISVIRNREGAAAPAAIALYEWIGSSAGERAVREYMERGGKGFRFVATAP